ncbi:hypothetical protein CC2G_007581 [Coprinopsis cinerea AmutBmut pab1-1]|nr:hypothetical protein CC2G_007581 [Coprinopsis cinerea AmutBmut pab1-1]
MSNKEAKTKASGPANNEGRSTQQQKAPPPPEIVADIERLTELVEKAWTWRKGRQDITKKQQLLDLTNKVYDSWNQVGWRKEALPSAIRQWFRHIASPDVADWDGSPEMLDLTFFRNLHAGADGDNPKKKSSKRKVAFEGQPQTTKKKKSDAVDLELGQGQGAVDKGKTATGQETEKGEKAAENQGKGGEDPPKPRPRPRPRPTAAVKANEFTSQSNPENDQNREFMMVVAGLNEGKERSRKNTTIGRSITTNPYSSDSGSDSSTSSASRDHVKARKAKRKATPPKSLENPVGQKPTLAKPTTTNAPLPPSQNRAVSPQVHTTLTSINVPAPTASKPAANPSVKNIGPKRPNPSHSIQERHRAAGKPPNISNSTEIPSANAPPGRSPTLGSNCQRFPDGDDDDDASYRPSNSSDDEGLGPAVGKVPTAAGRQEDATQASNKSSKKQTSKQTLASMGSSTDERWSRVTPFEESELPLASVSGTLHALTVRSHQRGSTIRQLESKISTITRALERNQNAEKTVPVLEKRLNQAVESLDELRQDLKAEQKKTAELEARVEEREKMLDDYRSNLKLLNGVVEKLLEVHGLRRVPDSTQLVPVPRPVAGSTQVTTTQAHRNFSSHPVTQTGAHNGYPSTSSFSPSFTRGFSTGSRLATTPMPASTSTSINSYASQGQFPNSNATSFHPHPDQSFHSDRSAPNAESNPLQPIISEVHRAQMDLPHELQSSPVQRASLLEMIAHSSVGTTPDMIQQMQMLDDRGSRAGRSSTSTVNGGDSPSDWGNITSGKFKYHPQNRIQQHTLDSTQNTPNDQSTYNGRVNAVGGLTIGGSEFQHLPSHHHSTDGEFHPIGSLAIAQDQ